MKTSKELVSYHAISFFVYKEVIVIVKIIGRAFGIVILIKVSKLQCCKVRNNVVFLLTTPPPQNPR